MKFLSKQEIKLFITFFVTYSFFIYWMGWNENSRFMLIRAIVDERRFEVDSYYNQTTDRAYYDGHYYTDKDPGASFLAVPIYAIWKFIYYNFFPENFKEKYAGSDEYTFTLVGRNKIPIIEYINPGFFILISMVLVTVSASSLFSALTIVLVYKISRFFTQKEIYKLLLAFTAGLGTLIFPSGLSFLSHSVTTFFIFLSFYLLFKIKQENVKDKKYLVLAGLLTGYAIVAEVVATIIVIIYLLYLFFSQKHRLVYFIAGVFIGMLPLFLYDYVNFNTLSLLSREVRLDTKIWGVYEKTWTNFLPNPFIMLRLMFFPHKGLFFYYPILFLSFFGLVYMYKKFKAESLLILFIFLAFLMLNSLYTNAWWGGASFGPRHLTPSIPFLVLPLVYVFNILHRKLILRILVYILIIYSIFINFAGLQSLGDEAISEDKVSIDPYYKEKINTFQIIRNPLYEYYIPLFFEYGPRSRIFENLSNGHIDIDIRATPFSKEKGFPFTEFYIPFLCLLPLTLFLYFLWFFVDEIKNKMYYAIARLKKRW